MRAADPRLVADLGRVLTPEQILSRPIDRLARSVDASIYRLIPEVVVRPRDLEEVRRLLAYARRNKRRLTFRTAGTSLSGQAVTDDVLVELAPHFQGCRVIDGGRRIWFQPGVVAGYLNRLLVPLGRRIGPDPASIEAAMMGGILANNSSGMCCGVQQNAYRTLDAIVFALADGTVVDTTRIDVDATLKKDRPDLYGAVLALRDEVRGDAALAELVRRRFSRKNTMGYRLDAFLDHDTPAQILAHLMIGSQGTLGFIAEATLHTVPELPVRATALLYFDELTDAGAAVGPLTAAGAQALEIIDSPALRAMAGDEPDVHPVPIRESTSALLCELREEDEAALGTALERAQRTLAGLKLCGEPRFATDAAERDRFWRLRRGWIPTTGGARPPGTAVVIEDVVIPVERLAEGIADLQALFAHHGYSEASIVGHAKDGNLHFLLAQDFSKPEVVDNYARFMDSLAELVVGRYDGALKAEHASGRNMAPFVRREWGERAYAVMLRIKALLDPDRILNPGVVLNDDPEVHLKNLKPLPAISPLADKCIECGFCEPRCPSRFVTLSPRQRIVAVRELTRLGALPGPEARAARAALAEDFAYEGVATCVGDSMCQTSCPVKIDTGALVKELRTTAQSRVSAAVAGLAARNFAVTARLGRAGLRAASAAQKIAPALVRRVLSGVTLPAAAGRLPVPAAPANGSRTAVYFPSCLTRVLGRLPGEFGTPQAEATLAVLEQAGFAVRYPDGLEGLCCGMPFASKGYKQASRDASGRTIEALWQASDAGSHPVVTDASPCAGTLRDAITGGTRKLRLLDFAAFWAQEVLPTQQPARKLAGTAVLHPTCTLVKGGGLPELIRVAEACAERVVVPAGSECCGFAGDRGFLLPQVTASATRREAGEVAALGEDVLGCFSTCRTCEIGMSRATGRSYRSIAQLVLEAMRGA